MPSDRAFIDTTILAEVLLKTGPSHDAAKRALGRYKETLLPVYAIKEWKRGQLRIYVLIYNQLTRTRSLSQTDIWLSKFFYRPRWQSTSREAQALATLHLPSAPMSSTFPDEELADRFRLAYRTLITLSWESRRSVTSATVLDLECYVESGPKEFSNGELDIHPRDCMRDRECCLAHRLRKNIDALLKLREAIPPSGRPEDTKRREALKKLAVHPTAVFDRKDCQALGDAYFAFFAPEDSEILTTNVKDHGPLAQSLGKSAVTP